MSNEDGRKATVENFLRMSFEQGRPEEAAERFMSDEYVQHSATAADGKAGFLAFATQVAHDHPEGLEIDIRRMLSDGDLVAAHIWVRGLGDPEGHGFAAVDIYRLDDAGRIVEHWDVLQPIPGDVTNPERVF